MLSCRLGSHPLGLEPGGGAQGRAQGAKSSGRPNWIISGHPVQDAEASQISQTDQELDKSTKVTCHLLGVEGLELVSSQAFDPSDRMT